MNWNNFQKQKRKALPVDTWADDLNNVDDDIHSGQVEIWSFNNLKWPRCLCETFWLRWVFICCAAQHLLCRISHAFIFLSMCVFNNDECISGRPAVCHCFGRRLCLFSSSLYKLEKDIECLSETLNKLLKSRQTVKARIMASMVLTNHNLRDRPDY